MKILDAQLTLAADFSKAKPDVFINPVGHLICHLTQGFNSAAFPNGQSNAITADAHVPIALGPGESIGNFNFGFVQIGRINPGQSFSGIFYAGRMHSEGSITVNPNVPPALASPILYDSTGSPPDPFFETPTGSFTPPKMNATWGDHPALKVPLKLRNSGRNVDNFLFHLILDREFWTIFTSTDAAAKITYIAHFHWQVRYDVELMWRNQNAVVRRNKSIAKVVDAKVKGAPTDADLQPLLAKPSGARANALYGRAMTQAFFGARGPNHTENDTRFANVPNDFWG